MKHFLCQLMVFCFVFVCAFLVLCISIRFYLHTKFQNELAEFQKSVVLVLGDSHTEMSINEEYYSGLSNASVSAETLGFSLVRLKKIGENNSNLKVIILGVTYHSLKSKEYSDSYHHYFINYPLMDNTLRKNNSIFPKGIINDMHACYNYGILTKRALVEIKKDIFERTKLFFPSTNQRNRERIASCPISIQKVFSLQDSLINCDKIFRILFEIKMFCIKHNFKLVLYTAPLYRDYYYAISDQYKLSLSTLVNKLVDNVNVFYFDYSSFFMPDSCYTDCDHLNIYGSRRLTPILLDSLKINNFF